MTAEEYKTFWVIFDTCTKPPYYQDVHNILAMPKGWIIRYNYSSVLLSESAKKFANSFPDAPGRVLLVYGQYAGYVRGQDDRESRKGKKMFWIPTRLAELVHVQIDGSMYYFDLKLLEYPSLEDGALGKIVDDLNAKKETPFNLWVSVSGCSGDLDTLTQRANVGENWGLIVDRFQRTETQFRGDSFWRLVGPYRASDKALFSPIIQESYMKDDKGKHIAAKRSLYKVANQQEFWFELDNREPKPRKPRTQKKAEEFEQMREKYELVSGRVIGIEDKSGRVRSQTLELALRPYFSQSVYFHVRTDKLLTEEESTVTFRTGPQSTSWPEGPNFDLTFKSGWLLWKIALGGLCALLGLTALFTGNKLPEASLPCAVGLFVIGTLLTTSSAYILYQELRFKY